jgi:uncharacterized protein (TIGR03067 family)
MSTAVLTTLLALAASPSDPPAGDGRPAFQGAWEVVSMEVGGVKPDRSDNREQPVTTGTIAFSGGRYVMKAGDRVVEEGTFTARNEKTPNRIEVAVTRGQDAGKKWHGIYELEGNTLRAVVGPADRPPPSKLTEPDPGTRAFTLKRVKNS